MSFFNGVVLVNSWLSICHSQRIPVNSASMDICTRAFAKHRFPLVAFLLLALLSLQATLLVHHYQAEVHDEAEPCELCLHQTSHGKYLSSAPVALFLASRADFSPSTMVASSSFATPLRRYQARAPPFHIFS